MPLFVMNITNVDDKILQAAEEANEPPLELARRFELEFWKDMDALNCLRPHVITRVSDYVESHIVPYIQKIVDAGFTYDTEQGVYFSVKAFDEAMQQTTRYGKLAPPLSSTDFYSRLGADETSEKLDVRDFVLWKRQKEGERMYWLSPWGTGRPGWHIECSAMIEAIQNLFAETHTFALHAGGMDLKFPHHTNEIAQAEAYHHAERGSPSKEEWIPHWLHTGHLHIDGRKMSKSLKNFITVQDLLNSSVNNDEVSSPLSCPADDFRLWCLGLSGPYRSAATYSADRIDEARALRLKIVRFLIEAQSWVETTGSQAISDISVWRDVDRDLFTVTNDASSRAVRALLFHDLDGSSFLSEILRIVSAGQAYLNQQSSNRLSPLEPIHIAQSTISEMLALVGFSQITCRQSNFTDNAASQIVGGEKALIDELARFRSSVRKLALNDIRTCSHIPSLLAILSLCDDARENVLPTLGIELFDDKADDESEGKSLWRFCLPRTHDDKGDNPPAKVQADRPQESIDLRSIPLKDFFSVGIYAGQFSAFSEDGLPTHHADGSPVSNKLLKKLKKKQEKHAARLKSVDSKELSG